MLYYVNNQVKVLHVKNILCASIRIKKKKLTKRLYVHLRINHTKIVKKNKKILTYTDKE